MGILSIAGVTTGATSAGLTAITTTSDFAAFNISNGNLFFFEGGGVYVIENADPYGRTFDIGPGYAEGAKTDVEAVVIPLFGTAAPAFQALLSANELFRRATSLDPLDMTLGLPLRRGDFGGQGAGTLLNASHNLNDIVVPGLYEWTSSDAPTGAPASGAWQMAVEQGYGRSVEQVRKRHTQSGVGGQLQHRTNFAASGSDAASAGTWITLMDTATVRTDVAMSSGVPTGGLMESASGQVSATATLFATVGDMKWWSEKLASGTMTLDIEVAVDASQTSQQINYPDNFMGGGTVFLAGMSHSDTTPNAALILDNVADFVALNSSFVLGLKSGGTQPDPATVNERLRLSFRGRWTA